MNKTEIMKIINEPSKHIQVINVDGEDTICYSAQFVEFLEQVEKLCAEKSDNEYNWILCSEKMPKEREWIGTKRFGTTISDEVYVTFETVDGQIFCDHIRFQNGKLSPGNQAKIDAISKGAKPIAWCKLPEPYKGE